MRLLLLAVALSACWAARPAMVSPSVTTTTTTRLLRTSSSSKLFEVLGTSYRVPPLLAKLKGSRRAVGNDYAALLHKESSDAMTAFLNSMFTQVEQEVLLVFLDFCWDKFLSQHTPQSFLDELAGMAAWHAAHPTPGLLPTHQVSRVFYTVANMPADPVNIVNMLEQELEPSDWPWWLRDGINEIISILEKMAFGCDA